MGPNSVGIYLGGLWEIFWWGIFLNIHAIHKDPNLIRGFFFGNMLLVSTTKGLMKGYYINIIWGGW